MPIATPRLFRPLLQQRSFLPTSDTFFCRSNEQRQAVNHYLQSSAIIGGWREVVSLHVDFHPAACFTKHAGCRALDRETSPPRPQLEHKLHGGGHWNKVDGHTGSCGLVGADIGELCGARSYGTGAVATLSNATLVMWRETGAVTRWNRSLSRNLCSKSKTSRKGGRRETVIALGHSTAATSMEQWAVRPTGAHTPWPRRDASHESSGGNDTHSFATAQARDMQLAVACALCNSNNHSASTSGTPGIRSNKT